MRMILTVSALLLLISGTALAGSGYDSCIKEEKALKAREAGECHGLRYILNPSACFATQKKLKEYTATDKCRKIGLEEQVDFNAPPVVPDKKAGAVSPPAIVITPGAARPGPAGSEAGTGRIDVVSPVAVQPAAPAVPQPEMSCAQLKDENARLRAEVDRLTTELEGYTKACR